MRVPLKYDAILSATPNHGISSRRVAVSHAGNFCRRVESRCGRTREEYASRGFSVTACFCIVEKEEQTKVVLNWMETSQLPPGMLPGGRNLPRSERCLILTSTTKLTASSPKRAASGTSLTYVDCPPSIAPPPVRCGHGAADAGAGRPFLLVDEHRYLPR